MTGSFALRALDDVDGAVTGSFALWMTMMRNNEKPQA